MYFILNSIMTYICYNNNNHIPYTVANNQQLAN